jgi:uncharacterized protein
MHFALGLLGWSLFGLAVVIGLLLDMVGLFGNWIILGAVVLAWLATGFDHFGPLGILVMLVLAAAGELIEFLAAAYGASRFGASRRSTVAAVVGCLLGAVVGTPWFPVLGTLAGACLGAFAGAALNEYLVSHKNPGDAAWSGLGAALGRVGGLVGKFLAGLLILLVAALTY